MTNIVKPAVDGNDVVIDFVLDVTSRAVLPLKSVSTDLPATGLVGNVPFVLVRHWDGDVDLFSTRPIVDVAVFASTYVKARDLARQIEDAAIGYPFRVSTGGRSVLVDKVDVPSPTVEVPWQEDSPIRRFQGTYQFSIRR